MPVSDLTAHVCAAASIAAFSRNSAAAAAADAVACCGSSGEQTESDGRVSWQHAAAHTSSPPPLRPPCVKGVLLREREEEPARRKEAAACPLLLGALGARLAVRRGRGEEWNGAFKSLYLTPRKLFLRFYPCVWINLSRGVDDANARSRSRGDGTMQQRSGCLTAGGWPT